jgi:hypothetical protein
MLEAARGNSNVYPLQPKVAGGWYLSVGGWVVMSVHHTCVMAHEY